MRVTTTLIVLISLACTGCWKPKPRKPDYLLTEEMKKQQRKERHEDFESTMIAAGVAGGAVAVGTIFSDPFRSLASKIRGDTPKRAALKMLNTQSADDRREGINYLSDRDWGRQEPYTERYRQMAKSDPDFSVRATAIRALNRSRDREAMPIFIAGLTDASEMVRLESAKALANMPDANAADALVRLVNNPDENRDVRLAATEALKFYKTIEVARTLIHQLNERDFGIAWQARRSLQRITGADHRYDEAAWLAYITGPDKPLG
jgi:hypothetical protein